ncbi:MAG: hypothetical protein WCR20_18435 [Verrucomicrobiota bacterium]
MKTAIGAPDPGEFERNQPHNLFNDRRVGGKAKNRAVGESLYNPKMVKKERPPHAPDKWNTIQPKPSKKTWR